MKARMMLPNKGLGPGEVLQIEYTFRLVDDSGLCAHGDDPEHCIPCHVAAERARCAEIVKRHLAPMTHDRAAILYDIEEGGSDAEAKKHDGE